MYKMITEKWVLIAPFCAILAGCSSVQPVAYTGITSSSYLTPNPQDDSGHIPYRYANQVSWGNYNRIIIDPVDIYRGSDSQFKDMSEEDKADLAAYMKDQFSEKLKPRFAIVSDAAQNTLRLKLTLTGATTNTPVLSWAIHVDPTGVGGLYDAVQAIRGEEAAQSGSVFYAVEIYDAPTHRLLSAYVTKQYPGAINILASFGALAASKTGIEKGADMLVQQLN